MDKAKAQALLDEVRSFIKPIRSLVAAENRRIREARISGKDVMDCGSRDEADLIQAQFYNEWPASRIDRLTASLPDIIKALIASIEREERLTEALEQVKGLLGELHRFELRNMKRDGRAVAKSGPGRELFDQVSATLKENDRHDG